MTLHAVFDDNTTTRSYWHLWNGSCLQANADGIAPDHRFVLGPFVLLVWYNKIKMSCRRLQFLLILAVTLTRIDAIGGDTLRSTAEIDGLFDYSKIGHTPVALEATVTHVLSEESSFVIADNSGRAAFLNHASKNVASGDVIRLLGYVYIGENGESQVVATNLTVVGRTPPTKPLHIPLAELDRKENELALVQVEGTVIDVFRDEIDADYVLLILKDGAAQMTASLAAAPDRTHTDLVNARVRITGVFVRTIKGSRKFRSPCLYISHPEDLSVLTPAPSDPFDVPELSDRLYLPPTDVAALGRRRVTGTVLAVWQQNHALLRTDKGRVVNLTFARTQKSPPCQARITAVGYPETDMFRVNLSKVVWREEAAGDPPMEEAPRLIDLHRELLDENGNAKIFSERHGDLVRLQGTVLSLPSKQGADNRLLLGCEEFKVPVDLGAHPDAADGISPGSVIEVTGRYLIEVDRWQPNNIFPQIGGVALVIRSPDDLRVIARPPWWTAGRLLVVILVLLAALIAVYIWNRALNRLAIRRGRELFREQVAKVKADYRVEERTRLAVELHDSLSQNLTGITLEVDAAVRNIDPGADKALRHLDLAAKTLASCREELRNCLWDLRNDTLGEADLNEAIRRTLAAQVGDVHLQIRFSVPRNRLTDNTAHAILRILRELAVNAVRHGRASVIRIAGSIERDTLRFSVTDDGCGFDVAHRPGIPEGHFGLQGVFERVETFEGKMSIESTPGKGTKVTVALNLPHAETKENAE